MLNSKSQADNNSKIELQKPIETTSSPTCTKPYVVCSQVLNFKKGNFDDSFYLRFVEWAALIGWVVAIILLGLLLKTK